MVAAQLRILGERKLGRNCTFESTSVEGCIAAFSGSIRVTERKLIGIGKDSWGGAGRFHGRAAQRTVTQTVEIQAVNVRRFLFFILLLLVCVRVVPSRG